MADEIILTAEARDRWRETVKIACVMLLERYPDLQPGEIGQEEVQFFDIIECAQISVVVRQTQIMMLISPDQYTVKGGGATDV